MVVEVGSGHAVEGGASAQGVCTHVGEVDEVTHAQLRQLGVLQNLIQPVTGGTPHASQELHRVYWCLENKT